MHKVELSSVGSRTLHSFIQEIFVEFHIFCFFARFWGYNSEQNIQRFFFHVAHCLSRDPDSKYNCIVNYIISVVRIIIVMFIILC